MLDAGLPPQAEEKTIRSVSPPRSHYASRSTTPGVSTFHGTSRHLWTISLPPRPQSSPPSLDMAIEPPRLAQDGPHGHQTRIKRARVDTSELDALPQLSQIPVQQNETGSVPHVPSLSELARSLRQRKYQAWRRCQVEGHLRSVQIASAQIARQLHNARAVQRTLAECIRSEDKPSFLNLFNAFRESLRDPLTSPDAVHLEGEDTTKDVSGHHPTFLDRLPTQSREVVVDLLGKVRDDGAFIASALARLTHKELMALLPSRSPSAAGESVFGASPWTASRTSRNLGYVVDSQTEVLSSMAYGSPLEMLMQGVRGVSVSPDYEDLRALDVWSTVCVGLLIERKPGIEKFVPAVLDVCASSAWPGKDRLELWMLEILQNATFLSEQPSKQSFRMRVQARQDTPVEDHQRAETFYSQAVYSLLDLLADRTGASVIPESVIRMSRAIWRKLQHSPGTQRGFTRFVITRWLFSPFFFDVLVLPEAFGLMLDSYISDNVRHRVLREIASRAQKAVLDVAYSWRHGNHVPVETASRVQAIMDCFQDSVQEPVPVAAVMSPLDPPPEDVHLAVSASDVVGLVNALFPQPRPASFSSDRDVTQSGLQSSASSISGFSLFRSSSDVEQLGPGLWVQEQSLTTLPDANLDVPSSKLWNEVQPAVSAGMDVTRLWEACAEIDDVLNCMSTDDAERWVTLVTLSGQSGIRAARDVLYQNLPCPTDQLDGKETGTEPSPLVTIIEDLLLRDDSLAALDHEIADPQPTVGMAVVQSQLLTRFNHRIVAARNRSQFLDELSFVQETHSFEAATVGTPGLEALRKALCVIENRVKAATVHNRTIINICETRLEYVRPYLEQCATTASTVAGCLDRLRDKMWYVADVRTSAAYDEARSISAALKVMGIPKKPLRTRLAPPLRHWSGSKHSATNLHLKTEAQILELLSTSPTQGGPNKLSDDQSAVTSAWMERNNIENLCRGEERLHRLCMQIRKCTDQLMTSDGAMVWSNPLFAHDKALAAEERANASSKSLAALQATSGRFRRLSLHTDVVTSIDAVSSVSHPLSSASSRDFVESRSPTLTNKSSIPFWSPAVTEDQSPSSVTSIGSLPARRLPVGSRNHQLRSGNSGAEVINKLRTRLTSLLLTDLGSQLYGEGSETDKAFWTGLGGDLTDRHLRSQHKEPNGREGPRKGDHDQHAPPSRLTFDFHHALDQLLRSFSACPDPLGKVAFLHDIDRLLAAQAKSASAPGRANTGKDATEQNQPSGPVPRSLAERCVDGFRKLFADSETRPQAVFRDMQYIAALVPATVLENTPQGKAFCNAAVAVSGLKQEICSAMVETADSIIAYQSNNRGHGRSSSYMQQQRDSATFPPSRTPSAEDIGRYNMADAAYLLQITAKEGERVAQRELATLYLTHPELMEHIIAPFARPKDVFKDELESKWRKNQDPNRCDPTTMCVAHHWMSLSSKGGDALAKEFLRQREEMERLP